MADNVDITPGTGKTIAADDISGVMHQRVKISQGADGAATDVSSAAPLQVTVANTGSNSTAIKVDNSAVTQPISGTVTANAGTGSFTVAQSTASNLKVDLSGTAANSTAIKVDGSAVTQPVSGTFWQTTQPVSGTVTAAKSTSNLVKGSASATGTSSTSVIAAAGANTKNYITTVSITNTGTANSLITLQDGSGGTALWYTIAPASGGSNITFDTPIATSNNTALHFAAGTGSTTIYVSAAGFTGA